MPHTTNKTSQKKYTKTMLLIAALAGAVFVFSNTSSVSATPGLGGIIGPRPVGPVGFLPR